MNFFKKEKQILINQKQIIKKDIFDYLTLKNIIRVTLGIFSLSGCAFYYVFSYYNCTSVDSLRKTESFDYFLNFIAPEVTNDKNIRLKTVEFFRNGIKRTMPLLLIKQREQNYIALENNKIESELELESESELDLINKKNGIKYTFYRTQELQELNNCLLEENKIKEYLYLVDDLIPSKIQSENLKNINEKIELVEKEYNKKLKFKKNQEEKEKKEEAEKKGIDLDEKELSKKEKSRLKELLTVQKNISLMNVKDHFEYEIVSFICSSFYRDFLYSYNLLTTSKMFPIWSSKCKRYFVLDTSFKSIPDLFTNSLKDYCLKYEKWVSDCSEVLYMVAIKRYFHSSKSLIRTLKKEKRINKKNELEMFQMEVLNKLQNENEDEEKLNQDLLELKNSSLSEKYKVLECLEKYIEKNLGLENVFEDAFIEIAEKMNLKSLKKSRKYLKKSFINSNHAKVVSGYKFPLCSEKEIKKEFSIKKNTFCSLTSNKFSINIFKNVLFKNVKLYINSFFNKILYLLYLLNNVFNYLCDIKYFILYILNTIVEMFKFDLPSNIDIVEFPSEYANFNFSNKLIVSKIKNYETKFFYRWFSRYLFQLGFKQFKKEINDSDYDNKENNKDVEKYIFSKNSLKYKEIVEQAKKNHSEYRDKKSHTSQTTKGYLDSKLVPSLNSEKLALETYMKRKAGYLKDLYTNQEKKVYAILNKEYKAFVLEKNISDGFDWSKDKKYLEQIKEKYNIEDVGSFINKLFLELVKIDIQEDWYCTLINWKESIVNIFSYKDASQLLLNKDYEPVLNKFFKENKDVLKKNKKKNEPLLLEEQAKRLEELQEESVPNKKGFGEATNEEINIFNTLMKDPLSRKDLGEYILIEEKERLEKLEKENGLKVEKEILRQLEEEDIEQERLNKKKKKELFLKKEKEEKKKKEKEELEFDVEYLTNRQNFFTWVFFEKMVKENENLDFSLLDRTISLDKKERKKPANFGSNFDFNFKRDILDSKASLNNLLILEMKCIYSYLEKNGFLIKNLDKSLNSVTKNAFLFWKEIFSITQKSLSDPIHEKFLYTNTFDLLNQAGGSLGAFTEREYIEDIYRSKEDSFVKELKEDSDFYPYYLILNSINLVPPDYIFKDVFCLDLDKTGESVNVYPENYFSSINSLKRTLLRMDFFGRTTQLRMHNRKSLSLSILNKMSSVKKIKKLRKLLVEKRKNASISKLVNSWLFYSRADVFDIERFDKLSTFSKKIENSNFVNSYKVDNCIVRGTKYPFKKCLISGRNKYANVNLRKNFDLTKVVVKELRKVNKCRYFSSNPILGIPNLEEENWKKIVEYQIERDLIKQKSFEHFEKLNHVETIENIKDIDKNRFSIKNIKWYSDKIEIPIVKYHNKEKYICASFYPGSNFASWISSIENLYLYETKNEFFKTVNKLKVNKSVEKKKNTLKEFLKTYSFFNNTKFILVPFSFWQLIVMHLVNIINRYSWSKYCWCLFINCHTTNKKLIRLFFKTVIIKMQRNINSLDFLNIKVKSNFKLIETAKWKMSLVIPSIIFFSILVFLCKYIVIDVLFLPWYSSVKHILELPLSVLELRYPSVFLGKKLLRRFYVKPPEYSIYYKVNYKYNLFDLGLSNVSIEGCLDILWFLRNKGRSNKIQNMKGIILSSNKNGNKVIKDVVKMEKSSQTFMHSLESDKIEIIKYLAAQSNAPLILQSFYSLTGFSGSTGLVVLQRVVKKASFIAQDSVYPCILYLEGLDLVGIRRRKLLSVGDYKKNRKILSYRFNSNLLGDYPSIYPFFNTLINLKTTFASSPFGGTSSLLGYSSSLENGGFKSQFCSLIQNLMEFESDYESDENIRLSHYVSLSNSYLHMKNFLDTTKKSSFTNKRTDLTNLQKQIVEYEQIKENSTNPRRIEMMLYLLTILDGAEYLLKNIIIICSSEDLSQLDPALLRPNRFDRIVEIQAPSFENRVNNFKQKVSKFDRIVNTSHTTAILDNKIIEQAKYFARRFEDFSSSSINCILNTSFLKELEKQNLQNIHTMSLNYSLLKESSSLNEKLISEENDIKIFSKKIEINSLKRFEEAILLHENSGKKNKVSIYNGEYILSRYLNSYYQAGKFLISLFLNDKKDIIYLDSASVLNDCILSESVSSEYNGSCLELKNLNYLLICKFIRLNTGRLAQRIGLDTFYNLDNTQLSSFESDFGIFDRIESYMTYKILSSCNINEVGLDAVINLINDNETSTEFNTVFEKYKYEESKFINQFCDSIDDSFDSISKLTFNQLEKLKFKKSIINKKVINKNIINKDGIDFNKHLEFKLSDKFLKRTRFNRKPLKLDKYFNRDARTLMSYTNFGILEFYSSWYDYYYNRTDLLDHFVLKPKYKFITNNMSRKETLTGSKLLDENETTLDNYSIILNKSNAISSLFLEIYKDLLKEIAEKIFQNGYIRDYEVKHLYLNHNK